MTGVLTALLLSLVVQVDTITPPTVVIVRHAEKSTEPAGDPGLTDEGRARAAALDSMLADANVSAILITQFRRNSETAKVVAERFGITPTVIRVSRDMTAYADAVAEESLKHSGTVLVVGHSNTLDEVVAALGGNAEFGDLCEHEYESAWLVVPAGEQTKTIRMRFGAPNPPVSPGCGTMR